jgi:hypothetical protein
MTQARRSTLAALLAAFAVTAGGCTDETTTSTSDAGTTIVAFDAKMKVLSPVDGACFPVPDGPDAAIPLTLSFTKADGQPATVYLRAPGFCTSIPNALCGHVVVKVDGIENNEGALPTVDVLLRKFATPYGTFAITVELVADNGGTLLVAGANAAGVVDLDAGIPLQTSLTVHAQPSCGGSSSSGGAGGGDGG